MGPQPTPTVDMQPPLTTCFQSGLGMVGRPPPVPQVGTVRAFLTGEPQGVHMTLSLSVPVSWAWRVMTEHKIDFPCLQDPGAAAGGRGGKWEDKQTQSIKDGTQVAENPCPREANR